MNKILILFATLTSFAFGQIDSAFIIPLDGIPKIILSKELAPEELRPVLNENYCEQTVFRKDDGCPGCKVTFRIDRQTYGPQVNIEAWAPRNNGGDGYCDSIDQICHQIIGCQYNGFLTLHNPLGYDLTVVSTIIMGPPRVLRANTSTAIPIGSSIPEYSRNCGSREEAIAFISSEYLLDQFTVIYISCSSCEDTSPHN